MRGRWRRQFRRKAETGAAKSAVYGGNVKSVAGRNGGRGASRRSEMAGG